MLNKKELQLENEQEQTEDRESNEPPAKQPIKASAMQFLLGNVADDNQPIETQMTTKDELEYFMKKPIRILILWSGGGKIVKDSLHYPCMQRNYYVLQQHLFHPKGFSL